MAFLESTPLLPCFECIERPCPGLRRSLACGKGIPACHACRATWLAVSHGQGLSAGSRPGGAAVSSAHRWEQDLTETRFEGTLQTPWRIPVGPTPGEPVRMQILNMHASSSVSRVPVGAWLAYSRAGGHECSLLNHQLINPQRLNVAHPGGCAQPWHASPWACGTWKSNSRSLRSGACVTPPRPNRRQLHSASTWKNSIFA